MDARFRGNDGNKVETTREWRWIPVRGNGETKHIRETLDSRFRGNDGGCVAFRVREDVRPRRPQPRAATTGLIGVTVSRPATGSSQPHLSSVRPSKSPKKSSCMRAVSLPGLPVPTGLPSTERIG